MMPLIDMMTQNTEAMKTMAKQFGLSDSQVEQAVEALMPAFSTGLKRNVETPDQMGQFLQALAGGGHAQYYENMSRAFSPEGTAEGNGILGHLFGSKDVSRAVAAQAAASTGLSQAILKQMLPIIASMVMGGLFKQATGASSRSASPGSGNVIGDILGQMMGGGATSRSSSSNNPLGDILGGMLGGAMGGQTGGNNPLGDILGSILGGGSGASKPAQPQAAPSEPARSDNPLSDIFGKMFEAGKQTQSDYQKGMESIFDQYLQGMNQRR